MGTVAVPEQSSSGANSCAGSGLPLFPSGDSVTWAGLWGVPRPWVCCDGEGRLGMGRDVQARRRQGSVATYLPGQEQGAKSRGLLETWLGLTPWAPRGGG